MSNYYDLKCLTCAEKTETEPYAGRSGWSYGNRMHKELLVVLMLRPELEALGLAYKRLQPEAFPAYTDFNTYNDPPLSRWSSFFINHVGHHIVVKSEYGNDAFFGCEKMVDQEYKHETASRENARDCRLDFNHDGACATTRPDGK